MFRRIKVCIFMSAKLQIDIQSLNKVYRLRNDRGCENNPISDTKCFTQHKAFMYVCLYAESSVVKKAIRLQLNGSWRDMRLLLETRNWMRFWPRKGITVLTSNTSEPILALSFNGGRTG